MSWLKWILLLCVTPNVFAHDLTAAFLQKDALRDIARCPTRRCVERVVATLDYDDPALRVIRAAKLAELRAPAAHAALVEAIPHDPASFWFTYSMTGLPSKDFKEVNRLYYAYFPAAAKVVAASGKRVREYLLLQRFSDGEIAALIAEQVDSIAKRNPTAYCAARSTLSAATRRSLRDRCKPN